MKKLIFIICACMCVQNIVIAKSTNNLIDTDNDLYSFPKLFEKAVESTVWIRSYYDSKLDEDYGPISQIIWGDIFEEQGRGTGFIYSEDGYIITNYHVLDDSNFFKVTFSDDSEYDSFLVGFDEDLDIAVLKINKENLTPLGFEESDIEIGQWVFTVGHPRSFNNSLSVGLISGLDRSYWEQKFIQFDMNINAGNSGGPVLNLEGKVVGMVRWKFRPEYATGMCFAIPSDIILKTADQIISEVPEN